MMLDAVAEDDHPQRATAMARGRLPDGIDTETAKAGHRPTALPRMCKDDVGTGGRLSGETVT